jgi:Tfp pilus assembly protein PilF
MKSLISRVSVIAVVAAFTASTGRAQDEPSPTRTNPASEMHLGSISGTVTLPSGHPVGSRVRITLSTVNDPGIAGYTDNNGSFSFSRLRSGNYTVSASADGALYDAVTEQVFLPRGGRANIRMALRPKGGSTSQPRAGVVSLEELSQKVPDAAKKEYDKAVKLANEGNNRQAIEGYKKAIAIWPEYLVARNDLGVQYLNLRQLLEAAEQFEAAIEINPNAFNPHLNLGIVLVKQKSYSSALERLNSAMAIDSSQPAAHLYLGIASVETDDLVQAEKELKSALVLGGPEYSIAHYYMAHVKMKTGDRDGAIRELQTYLDTSPRGEEAERARVLLEKIKDAGGR